MPGIDGIEATRRLPRHRVLILTTFGLDEYIVDALRAGASGFLLKDAPVAELVAAVRAVAAGDAVLSPPVTRRLLDRVARRLPPAARAPPATARDAHRARARGAAACSPAACRTRRSPRRSSSPSRPSRRHVSNLLGKLGLRDRVQAVIYAYETGLVAPSA